MVFDLAGKRLSGFRHIDDRGLSSGRYRLKHVGRLPRQWAEIFIEAMHASLNPFSLNGHRLANVAAMNEFFKGLDGIPGCLLPTLHPAYRRRLECVYDARVDPKDYLDRLDENLGTTVAWRRRRY